MRINQFVSGATGLSRRAADAQIKAGHVTINGRPATLGASVDPAADIRLNGQPLQLPQTFTYVMLNKPAGYVSSRARQGSDPTLYELLPPEHHTLRITGRLDRDSSGLVILTDDGEFIQRHTHPSFEKDKVYELKLSRAVADGDLRHLAAGVKLSDGLSQVKVLQTDGRKLRVSLSEGRNRQLRRTFGALGYTVERLHRVQMGPHTLGDLPSGAWTKITAL